MCARHQSRMEHFCWFIKLLFLLLMMLEVPTIETRALRGHTQQTDIIAGTEFLKLFLERDELQRQLHSNEYQDRGGGRGKVSYYDDNGDGDESEDRTATEEITTISKVRSRSTSGRSLESKSRNANEQSRGGEDSHKSQVVKLVTSGSKIVFLEDEYDEEDAVADAVEIELKKERKSRDKVAALQQQRSPMSDEVKVVAVSVSSSSQRAHARERYLPHGLTKHMNSFAEVTKGGRHEQHHNKSHNSNKTTSSTSQSLTAKKSTTTTTTTTSSPTIATSTSTTTTAPAALDFINRSHKSEFLIEEAEPLTMLKNTPSFSTSTHLFYDTDSENSASTNIRNVLAVPASGTDSLSSSSARNASHTNQSSARTRSYIHGDHSSVTSTTTTTSSPTGLVEDKLLPFQTVIYHDTKEGHGPQSRSISYSSISQNVEDLQAWQKSGILAEAQRNVSESLKPLPRPPAESQTHTHTSEPAKFYSLPSQMYSVPAKFYSEPAKVYSEPAKVYGQPEKVYSEPAKVYGQPAKFYSEPAKVYSQPAKVYSEPAKTYWPRPLPAATTSTTTVATTSSTAAFTTTTPTPFATSSSRRPAIVSRIAFGEAQTTQVPTDTGQQHQTQTNRQYPNQHSQNIHHHQQQQQQQQQQQHHHHHHHHHHLHHASHADNLNSQPRRVLFNLDRLPYDLLNAPEQTPEHHIPSSAAAADNGYNVGRQRPCWEPPSLLPTSSTSSQQHQHQSHSSLLDQHSNQNAKGLPNRDLVKCVPKYSHSSAASLAKRPNAYTTEHSHIDELYTPTPEQNYEIEESVSVMTNGRAHGVQVFGGPTTATTTTRSHMRGGGNSGDSGRPNGIHHHATLYNTNANANVDDVEPATDENYDEDQSDNNNNDDGDAEDAVNANDSGNNKNNNNGKDDSKVAYVLEGRNFRKYRVEEKTDDGFIVGEYGVVDHQDGNLRGVRYTADSTINRSLIQKALLTFLKLK